MGVRTKLCWLVLLLVGCGKMPTPPAPVNLVALGVVDPVTKKPKVHIEDIEMGKGDIAENGKLLVVEYDGKLLNGNYIVSSKDLDEPDRFILGKNPPDRIIGYEEGLRGMRVGGYRRVTIPPELGYGEKGKEPKIPPNAILVYELKLLDVETPVTGKEEPAEKPKDKPKTDKAKDKP